MNLRAAPQIVDDHMENQSQKQNRFNQYYNQTLPLSQAVVGLRGWLKSQFACTRGTIAFWVENTT